MGFAMPSPLDLDQRHEPATRAKCRACAVERYCGNYVPDGLVRGTARDLAAAGLSELARYVTFGASPRASINMVLGVLEASRGQILIDGHEVDTLAGHIDLRHPIRRNSQIIR